MTCFWMVGSRESEWSSLEGRPQGIPHSSEGHLPVSSCPVVSGAQVYMNIYPEVLTSLGSCGSLTPSPALPPPGTVTEAG